MQCTVIERDLETGFVESTEGPACKLVDSGRLTFRESQPKLFSSHVCI